MAKRRVDLIAISDVHLGTENCRAAQLLAYLKSVKPRKVVLVGDIVDLWQVKHWHMDSNQMKVLRRLLKWAGKGVPIIYVTGNHDEAFRPYASLMLGKVSLVNRCEMDLAGVKTLFVHGDVFDHMRGSPKWLRLIGGWAYDGVLMVNALINRCRRVFGWQPLSLATLAKRSLPAADRYIERYARAMADLAHDGHYQTIVCGHIHHPDLRVFATPRGPLLYANCGDWVEHATALEWHAGQWRLVNADGTTRAASPETIVSSTPADPSASADADQHADAKTQQ